MKLTKTADERMREDSPGLGVSQQMLFWIFLQKYLSEIAGFFTL